MDVLEKLFGSSAKVKIIKLFLFNPDKPFDYADIAIRTKVSQSAARREVYNLEKVGFIKERVFNKETHKQQNRKIIKTSKKVNGFVLDPKFQYLEALESLLTNVNLFQNKDFVEKISRAGKIQLLVVAGLFIKDPESRLDLMVVGDNIKEGMLETIIKNIESQVGKELRYAVFETSDFNYRYSIFDKLVRDVLEFPHDKIINRIGV